MDIILLLLSRGNEPRAEAEATTSGESIVVRFGEGTLATPAMPESIMHYVVRTREGVHLPDPSSRTHFQGIHTFLGVRPGQFSACR